MRLIMVGAVAVLLLVGCGPDPVQQRWAARDQLPSCGEVTLDRGELLEQKAGDELACMRGALETRKGAELKVTSPTLEGDPIRKYIRITPDGMLEIYTDTASDRFSQQWYYTRCQPPAGLSHLRCTG